VRLTRASMQPQDRAMAADTSHMLELNPAVSSEIAAMASFFYHDGNDAPTQGTGLGHLKAIPGGKGAKPPAPLSVWGESLSAGNHTERRAQVTPPDLFARSPSTLVAWLRRGWAWLWDMEELPRKAAPTTGLAQARTEFHSAIWDLQSLKANQLREHIAAARSLRELWHLRADVFKLISVHRGQAEAQTRIDVLDSHFPVRASTRNAHRGKVTAW
jgi:hypothetical protein